MPQAPLIAEAGDLQDLMARLVGETTIALDTEASSFHRFHERIGLIQLSNRQDTWLIDPLAVQNMDGLGQLLGSVQGETVVHDADFDLRLLKRMYGFRVRHIFDTLIAAELINGKQLAALLAVSERTLYRLKSTGELPAPVVLGGSVRWRLAEIRGWIAKGCPRPMSSK